MLPHLNCIILKDNRYHWCASTFYDGEQFFSLVEVKPTMDRFSKVKGYDILVRLDKLKLITILSREEILHLKYEKKIKVLPAFKMALSEKMMFEILKKEAEYVVSK